jgi:excisionase family DNA binding protein
MSEQRPDDTAMIVTMTRGELRALIREEAGKANAHRHVLLTAEQLAAALQVNKATIYEWAKAKTIPYYQAGRFVRFNLTEILEAQRKYQKEAL